MANRISSFLGAGDDERRNKLHRSSRSVSPPDNSPTASPQLHVTKTSRKPLPQQPNQSHSQATSQHPPYREPTLPQIYEPTLRDLRDIKLADPGVLLPPPVMDRPHQPRASSWDRFQPGRSVSPDESTGYRRSGPALQTPTLLTKSSSATDLHDTDKKKKHWWNRSGRKDDQDLGPKAWIAGHPHLLAYDVDRLMNAQPAQELWDDALGNCYVHLFPRTSNRGASFKVNSAIFASSPVLKSMASGGTYSPSTGRPQNHRGPANSPHLAAQTGRDPSTPPLSPKRFAADARKTPSPTDHRNQEAAFPWAHEVDLYMPIRLSTDASVTSTPPRSDDAAFKEDMQALIDCRNFFAFLCGQSLVATEQKHSMFDIFMTIATLLKSFGFTNADGSTYGDAANASFDGYVEELGLADVRSSREKIIESIVLGEYMRSVSLYNEAFTHGAGRHPDILALRSPRFDLISSVTQTRLTRAHMDLEKRTASIRLILTDFDFPFLFSGIMNSKTTELRKMGVRFDAWKESFMGMRKFVIGLYKQRYGDWPPKASSKKNTLETSGLNRLVLRDVYHDLTSLYDLLVDRTRLTTRTIDGLDLGNGDDEPKARGLRAVLSEYDRSSPPVKPPVPFDLPLIPTLKSTRPDFGSADPKKTAKEASKKIKDDEIHQILRASWNQDALVTPFVDAFRDMERRAAHGCNLGELEDLRMGQWIFMYVVLQALPMLACDAPGLKWTRGVEYFLCEPPRSGVPWADPSMAGAARRTWFSVGGEGGNVVSLPSDIVEHGVEGIYHRSHCWRMAEQWTASNPILNAALHEQQHPGGEHGPLATRTTGMSGSGGGTPMNLAPPRAFSGHAYHSDSRSSSVSLASRRVSSFGGLEALNVPNGMAPGAALPSHVERPLTPKHSVDVTKTFDAILADVDSGKTKKKR